MNDNNRKTKSAVPGARTPEAALRSVDSFVVSTTPNSDEGGADTSER